MKEKLLGSDEFAKKSKRSIFRAYIEIIKPERTLANVITAVAGFVLASGGWIFDPVLFLKIILGSSLIIASACVFNNVLDRKIDGLMERTSKRALVKREISISHATWLLLMLGLAGFVILASINWLTFMVGAVAYVSYVFIYGYAKRKTIWSTLIGTLPGGLSIVAGYTAVTNQIDSVALMLFLILLTWQMAHFYAIAVYRRKDYAQASLPIWSVKKGVESTRFQIILFIVLYILSVVALSLAIGRWILAVVGVILSVHWLMVSLSKSGNWAKRSFSVSLSVLVFTCAALTVGL